MTTNADISCPARDATARRHQAKRSNNLRRHRRLWAICRARPGVLVRLALPSALGSALLAAIALHALTAGAAGFHRHCANLTRIAVPGAQYQRVACLADMTTYALARTDYTNPANYVLQAASATVLPRGVPGVQIDGYFPDTSTFNTNHGWNHDAQFVIRLPDRWNGRLVITGAPGVLTQYTQDPTISDKVISEGYAYASTDKGNGGATFYTDGSNPGDALVEWNRRVTQLAIAAKGVIRQRYGRRARYTYVTGVSNGGYFARWELEHNPELFDGGVDWEGTLFNPTGHNLLDYLPIALREYPRYRATGDPAAHQAMIAAGFPSGSEYLWDFYYQHLWDNTQRLLRTEVDPGWDGGLQAGHPFCQSGTPDCDADYQFSRRPAAQHAMQRLSLSGHIKRPLITLHGTLDPYLPIANDSNQYARLVRAAGQSAHYRYYRIQDGSHLDGLHDLFPQVRPILPCYWKAFRYMTRWVERHRPPPPSRLVRKPRHRDVANTCPGL
jgi:Tannase and feruloyl esterase